MTADDVREEIARALTESLNIAEPLGHIFGSVTGDAATVLVGQEIEVAADAILPIVARREQEAVAAERAKIAADIRARADDYRDGRLRHDMQVHELLIDDALKTAARIAESGSAS